MKTIQLKDILCILGLLLSVSELAGQKVITNHPSANGYPVIDLTELSPLHCVLTPAEAADRRTQMNAQTPSNTEFLGAGSGASGVFGTWNAKMPSYYQVMRTDHVVGATDWASAYNACKEYKDEGGTAGQWRLPTYRELVVIRALHPQLLGKGSFNPILSNRYWSCSEEAATSVWHVIFNNGDTHEAGKTNAYYVRCVRDLE